MPEKNPLNVQLRLPRSLAVQATRRADRLAMSMAEYLRHAVRRDLGVLETAQREREIA